MIISIGNRHRMENNVYDLTFEMEETYWWYAGRRTILLDRIQSLVSPGVGGKPRILEFGCGTGITLARLSEWAEAFGIDASSRALAYCMKRGLKNLHWIDPRKPFEPENPFLEPFDIILLLDVLEHVEDEISLLKMLRSWLKPGGSLLVTVPAFPLLWSGEDVVSHHLRRYRKNELIEVLHHSGFHIQRVSYFNFILFPLQIAVIGWNRWFRTQSLQQSNVRSLPPAFNAILTSIFTWEKYFLTKINLPIGGSILAISCREE